MGEDASEKAQGKSPEDMDLHLPDAPPEYATASLKREYEQLVAFEESVRSHVLAGERKTHIARFHALREYYERGCANEKKARIYVCGGMDGAMHYAKGLRELLSVAKDEEEMLQWIFVCRCPTFRADFEQQINRFVVGSQKHLLITEYRGLQEEFGTLAVCEPGNDPQPERLFDCFRVLSAELKSVLNIQAITPDQKTMLRQQIRSYYLDAKRFDSRSENLVRTVLRHALKLSSVSDRAWQKILSDLAKPLDTLLPSVPSDHSEAAALTGKREAIARVSFSAREKWLEIYKRFSKHDCIVDTKFIETFHEYVAHFYIQIHNYEYILSKKNPKSPQWLAWAGIFLNEIFEEIAESTGEGEEKVPFIALQKSFMVLPETLQKEFLGYLAEHMGKEGRLLLDAEGLAWLAEKGKMESFLRMLGSKIPIDPKYEVWLKRLHTLPENDAQKLLQRIEKNLRRPVKGVFNAPNRLIKMTADGLRELSPQARQKFIESMQKVYAGLAAKGVLPEEFAKMMERAQLKKLFKNPWQREIWETVANPVTYLIGVMYLSSCENKIEGISRLATYYASSMVLGRGMDKLVPLRWRDKFKYRSGKFILLLAVLIAADYAGYLEPVSKAIDRHFPDWLLGDWSRTRTEGFIDYMFLGNVEQLLKDAGLTGEFAPFDAQRDFHPFLMEKRVGDGIAGTGVLGRRVYYRDIGDWNAMIDRNAYPAHYSTKSRCPTLSALTEHERCTPAMIARIGVRFHHSLVDLADAKEADSPLCVMAVKFGVPLARWTAAVDTVVGIMKSDRIHFDKLPYNDEVLSAVLRNEDQNREVSSLLLNREGKLLFGNEKSTALYTVNAAIEGLDKIHELRKAWEAYLKHAIYVAARTGRYRSLHLKGAVIYDESIWTTIPSGEIEPPFVTHGMYEETIYESRKTDIIERVNLNMELLNAPAREAFGSLLPGVPPHSNAPDPPKK